MTKGQFRDHVAPLLGALWPNVGLDKPALAAYYGELEPFETEAVAAAIQALSRDGREFVPPVGVIVRKLAELAVDAPSWGEVLRALKRAGAYGGNYLVDGEPRDLRAEKLAECGSPLIVEFVETVGWSQIDVAEVDGNPTAEAQLREKWLAFARWRLEAVAYAGIEAPPELRRLERAANGRRELKRMTADRMLAAVSGGEEAA